MTNRRLILLADAIYLAHATFTLAMLLSPLVLPWQVVAYLCVGVAVLNVGGRCPVTVAEFWLRRRATRRWLVHRYSEWYAAGDTILLFVEGEKYKDFNGRHYIHEVGSNGLLISRYIPSESVMARLLRVIGIHLTPTQVQRLMLVLLVGLPLAAYLRESLIG